MEVVHISQTIVAKVLVVSALLGHLEWGHATVMKIAFTMAIVVRMLNVLVSITSWNMLYLKLYT